MNPIKRFLIGFMFLVFVVGFGNTAFAEEYTNIGFKKEVPKELKQKFPMCEEFLDVKWIDAKGQMYLGKLKTEMFYRPAKPNAVWGKHPRIIDEVYSPEEKVEWTFLVLSKEWSSYSGQFLPQDYSTYHITEEEYNSKKFEEFMKNASIHLSMGGFQMRAKYGKKKFETTSGYSPHHPKGNKETVMTSFARYTKNICLLDPNNNVVLVVEDKRPFQNDDMTPELKQKYEAIMKFANDACSKIFKGHPDYQCDLAEVRYGTLIDVNNDGKEDYEFWFGTNDSKGKPVEGFRYVYFLNNEKPEFFRMQCQNNGLYWYSHTKDKGILCTLLELTKDKTNKKGSKINSGDTILNY